MQLYETIQALRMAHALTQADLAERLEVSRQSVQKWESGATSPDIGKLPELAKVFGISVDVLLNVSLSRDELLATALRPQEPPGSAQAVRSEQGQRRSVLDYLLMAPLALGAILILGMFYGFGALFAGIGFAMALASLLCGIAAIPVAVMNLAKGVPAVLVAVAGIFLGLGGAWPLYCASTWWWKVYTRLAKRLTARLRRIDVRSLLR